MGARSLHYCRFTKYWFLMVFHNIPKYRVIFKGPPISSRDNAVWFVYKIVFIGVHPVDRIALQVILSMYLSRLTSYTLYRVLPIKKRPHIEVTQGTLL